jgi:nucleoside-diphosphate-sugar epimerase
MYKILVTGATGFVGRHALPRLIESGAQIHAVTRSRPAERFAGVHWLGADLLDSTKRAELMCAVRPDMLVHFAWETATGRFWSARSNIDWTVATLDLLRLGAEHGIGRVVGVGSCAEYAGGAKPCQECHTAIAPNSLYGAAKDGVRRVLQAYAEQDGLSWAWARLFHPTGADERQDRLVPSVAAALASGTPVKLTSGSAIRDVIDVRDAGRAIAELALSPVKGPVNIGRGEPVSIRQLAETLGRIAGRPDLLHFGALPDRAGEPPHLVADIDRLINEVGFQPQKTLEESLSDILDHWRRRSRQPKGSV